MIITKKKLETHKSLAPTNSNRTQWFLHNPDEKITKALRNRNTMKVQQGLAETREKKMKAFSNWVWFWQREREEKRKLAPTHHWKKWKREGEGVEDRQGWYCWRTEKEEKALTLRWYPTYVGPCSTYNFCTIWMLYSWCCDCNCNWILPNKIVHNQLMCINKSS